MGDYIQRAQLAERERDAAVAEAGEQRARAEAAEWVIEVQLRPGIAARDARVAELESSLAAERDKAKRDLAEYMKSLAEYLGCDMEEYALPAAHGNDPLRHAGLIQLKLLDIVASRDRLAADARGLLRLVRDCEWEGGGEYQPAGFCPVCECPKKHGHSPGCTLAAALAAGGGGGGGN